MPTKSTIPFVSTSVSERVLKTVNSTVSLEWNAAIVGAPGVGKTRAVQEFVERTDCAHFIEITPMLAGSMRLLLTELADAIGLPTYKSSPLELEGQLKRYAHYRHVVIVDEAQNLPDKHLRQLLHLSVEDGGGLIFVFCGNHNVLKKVNVDSGAFAQIGRRIPLREDITAITDGDVDSMASAAGVEGMDAYRLLHRLGKAFHAGGIVQALEIARRAAGTGAIGLAHIRIALGALPRFHAFLQ